MTTCIRVDRDDEGRPRVALRGDHLAARLLQRDAMGIRIALVATVALLLAEDDVRIEIEIAADVSVEIVETAATVAYDMRGRSARWQVDACVAAGATLTWLGLPFVISHGADVERVSVLTVADSAVVLLRDTVVLGRHGQQGGDLTMGSTVLRPNGRPLLRERLDLDRPRRQDPVVLGQARVIDTLTVIGARLPATYVQGAEVLELAAGGGVVRVLCDELHRSGLDRTADAVSKCLGIGRCDDAMTGLESRPRAVVHASTSARIV